MRTSVVTIGLWSCLFAVGAAQAPPGSGQDVVVDQQPPPTIKEDVVVVASTRTDRGLDDQPVRVDVLPREEIEEKMLMTPGDEANPFSERSEPYVIVGLLAERQFGAWRLFVNGENLTSVRQTRWQPLVRPNRSSDGRWTVDAWAPLEGRNVNGGLRVRF